MEVLFQRSSPQHYFPGPSTLPAFPALVYVLTWAIMFKASGNFLCGSLIPEWIKRSLLMIIGLETAGHSRIFKSINRSLPLWSVKIKGLALGENPLEFNPIINMTSYYPITDMQKKTDLSVKTRQTLIPIYFALQTHKEWEELLI